MGITGFWTVLVGIILISAVSGTRRTYSYSSGCTTTPCGTGAGGYSSGYTAGSSYSRQSSYSQKSQQDLAQLGNGAEVTYDDEGQQELEPIGDSLEESLESRRTQIQQGRASSTTGGQDSQLGGYNRREGWSSSSSWSSQSQNAATKEAELESLLQNLQTQGPANLTESGSLGPGHSYHYQRRSYNWSSNNNGSAKPYSCRSCNASYAFRRGRVPGRQGTGQEGRATQYREQQSSYLQGQSGSAQGTQSSYSSVQGQGSSGSSSYESQRQSTTEELRQTVEGESRQARATRQPPIYYYHQNSLQQQENQQQGERQSIRQESVSQAIDAEAPPPTTPRSHRGRHESHRADVTCSNGIVRGQLITTALGQEVYAFLGIPYAEPPVGDLRFQRPQPIANWDQPIIARSLPPACVQTNGSMFPDNPGEAQWNPTSISEDCLYLNIWVPASVFRNRNTQAASVMFWIYGGGFYSGSASLDIYNGAVLASERDIVVVSPQYRVGPLGFLYLNTPDAPGNVGFLDQIEALKWTNTNIEYFGGNRDSITLIGESAGAASVSAHLISPLSRNLFARAILLSGLITTSYGYTSPDVLERNSLELAKLAGCDNTQSTSEIIRCLRNADALQLSTLQFRMYKFLDFPFKLTIDGYSMPDCPLSLLEQGATKRTDILTGAVKDEGTYFTMYQFIQYLSNRPSPQITREKFVEMANKVFSHIYSTAELETIINYYTNWKNPEDGHVNLQRLNDAVSDAFFVCPAREFADMWSRRGQSVWEYRFTQRTSSNPWPEWMGVMHADEIEYIFGVPLREPGRFTQEEQQLCSHMMTLFTNFAKYGYPSNNWERYTEQKPVFVDFNANHITDEVSLNNLGPRASECVFWSKILPTLRRNSVEEEVDVQVLIQKLTSVCTVSQQSQSSRRGSGGTCSASQSKGLLSLQGNCQC